MNKGLLSVYTNYMKRESEVIKFWIQDVTDGGDLWRLVDYANGIGFGDRYLHA